MKYFIITISLIVTWALASIIEEIIYEKFCEYQNYTVQIHYLNGDTETKIYKLPKNISLRINCTSHKGTFKNCSLGFLPTDLKLSTGHFIDIVDGVNYFKLIKIDSL